MNKNQFILIGIGIVALVALFFLGKRHDPHAGHEHPSGTANSNGRPQQGAGMPKNNVEPAKFSDLYTAAKQKLTGQDVEKEKKLALTANTTPKPEHYRDIAEFWDKIDLNIAAHYYKKGALLENTEKSITFAGNLFTLQMGNTPEAEIKEWQANEAIECFNKALEQNPKNLDTKIALASCYIDGTGEIMKGVGALKEVTAIDSMNTKANLLLGKLSVQSGQHEKAIKRLNVVLSQDSKNTEALYFLAETHKNMGNKEKAIELFEQCKKIVNNPEFSAEIDNYIRSFN